MRNRHLSLFLLQPSHDWFRKDDDVRWQRREATWTTNGSPKGGRNQAHQYASPKQGNASFAWMQHFIHHLTPTAWPSLHSPHLYPSSDRKNTMHYSERTNN
jgi:hypothetical protein